jgi:hypothetical protein
MKKIIMLSTILFWMINKVNSDQIYNYYRRNIDGSYNIANIEEKMGINYFKYLLMDDGKEKKVIGYYYNKDTIKFVDIINKNNNIESSKYFDINNNLVYHLVYIYDLNNKLVSLIIECTNDSFVFRSMIEIVYINNIICIKANRYIKNTLAELNIVSSKSLDSNYLPLYNETVVIGNINNILQSFKLIEIYKYDNTKIQTYEAYENGSKVVIEEYEYNENLIVIEEKRYDIDGIFYIKVIKTDGIIVEEKIKTIDGVEFELIYSIYEIEKGLFFKNNDTDYFLICDDEIVTLKKVEEQFIPTQYYLNLRIKLDPFFDFRFISPYFNMITGTQK